VALLRAAPGGGKRPLTAVALRKALEERLHESFGDFGLGATLRALQIKAYEPASGLLIVRCARTSLRQVWAGLSFLTKVEDRRVAVNVVCVAASARTCRKKVMAAISDHLGRRVEPGALAETVDAAAAKVDEALK